jgi:hypothetical protein
MLLYNKHLLFNMHCMNIKVIKTQILYSATFFRWSCRLWDNVEKYVGARQATDDNINGACAYALDDWGYEPSEYVILLAFPRQQWLPELASMLCLRGICALPL